jgi:hypothetical protein
VRLAASSGGNGLPDAGAEAELTATRAARQESRRQMARSIRSLFCLVIPMHSLGSLQRQR